MKRIIAASIMIIVPIFANKDVTQHKIAGVYGGIEGGASISNNVLFAPDWNQMGTKEHSWFPVKSDSFETNLGTHKCIGAKIGYQFNPIIGIEATYAYRGTFNSIRGYATDTSPSYGEIYAINCITIQTVLFNINLSPHVAWGGFIPFVNSGIGVAINKTGSIRNYDVYNATNSPAFDTRVTGKRCNHFAWQIGLGVNYMFLTHWQFGLGYRYLDIGKLETCDRFVDIITNQTGTVIPFVAQHPSFNEIFASLVYCF